MPAQDVGHIVGQVGARQGEGDVGLEESGLAAAVEAGAFEAKAVEGDVANGPGHGVGQLDLSSGPALVALKLVAHPLLVWFLAAKIFGLPPLWTAVATLAAAMPTGATVFIFARGYGIYVARATSATLIANGLAIATVAAVLVILTGN